MKRMFTTVFMVGVTMLLLGGCSGESEEPAAQAAAAQPVYITVEAPEPIPIPAPQTVTSDSDWAAKAHNKEIEVIEVINIINPIAVYITKGFELSMRIASNAWQRASSTSSCSWTSKRCGSSW